MIILWLLIPFVVLLVVGVPIAFSLAGSAAIFFVVTGQKPLLALTQSLYSAADVVPLMAVPFFFFAGEVFARAGLTEKLVAFVQLLVGRLSGGLAHVTVVASAMLAAVMGSAVATTAAIGSVMIPGMKRSGYDSEFAAAVCASGGILGPIIPPSILFIIAGAALGVSVAGLFLGGIIPGIVMACGFGAVIAVQSKRRRYGVYKEPISLHIFLRRLGGAVLALIMPLIIMGGILSGVFTPTESGAIASLYVVLVGLFVLRSLTLKSIWDSLKVAGVMAISVLIILVGSAPFTWILSVYQAPQKIAEVLMSVSTNPLVVFLLMVGAFVVLGMFIETTANTLMVGPIMLSTALTLGADKLWFVVLMCMAFIVGMITPPVAATIFVGARVAGVPFERVTKNILPFAAAAIATLVLVIAYPDLVLFLPRTFGFA
jgi:tripartite ATP-independent transporter DctM subunit